MPSVRVRPPVLVGAVVSPIRSASGRNSNRPTRSVSSDELDPAQHRRALLHLAGQLGTRLRTDAQVAAGLTITIRYADGATTTRTLPESTPPASPPPPSTATPSSWSCTTPPNRTADNHPHPAPTGLPRPAQPSPHPLVRQRRAPTAHVPDYIRPVENGSWQPHHGGPLTSGQPRGSTFRCVQGCESLESLNWSATQAERLGAPSVAPSLEEETAVQKRVVERTATEATGLRHISGPPVCACASYIASFSRFSRCCCSVVPLSCCFRERRAQRPRAPVAVQLVQSLVQR
ncbi:DinB/UmuC family translesion DNA polymerase [Streptomyces anulatus]